MLIALLRQSPQMSPPTNEGIVAGEADGGVDKSRMDVIQKQESASALDFRS